MNVGQVRRSAAPDLPHVGAHAQMSKPAAPTIDVFVKYNGATATVRLPVTASDTAVKDAIAIGSGTLRTPPRCEHLFRQMSRNQER